MFIKEKKITSREPQSDEGERIEDEEERGRSKGDTLIIGRKGIKKIRRGIYRAKS